MKQSFILFAFVVVVTLPLLLSCNKQNAEGLDGQNKLSIVTDDISVAYTGKDDIKIEFICESNWIASVEFEGSEKWAEFVGESDGYGSGYVIVSVAENISPEERTAVVAVKSGDLEEFLTIRQDAKKMDITFKHPSLAFTREQLDKIKKAYEDGAPSIVSTINYVLTRANNGLSYDPEKVTKEQKQENKDMELLYKSARGPAMSLMNLLMASNIVDDKDKKDAYLKKAVEIMYSWAVACKDVDYPISPDTGSPEDTKTGAGMYLSRVMFPHFVCYDYLKNTEYIDAEQKNVVESWFRSIVGHIKASMNAWETNDYFQKQEWQNHLVAHMWGLLSIGYALDDAALVQYAIDSPENPRDFYELIEGTIFIEGDTPHHRERKDAPKVQAGEIYDRYRHDTAPLKGLQYSSLSLQILSSAARICKNNGIDMYAYTADGGENIRLAYEFYADFYITKDANIKGGYYSGETSRIGKAGDAVGLFELGYNAYPESEKIKEMIASIQDRGGNSEEDNLHYNLGYLRLYSIDVDSSN